MKVIKDLVAQVRGIRHLELLVLLALVAALGIVWLNGMEKSAGDAQSSALEARMESVLSKVEGAGNVKVLVREKDGAVSAFSQTSAGAPPQVEGVVVVAEGAGDVRVALELSRAVKALLGIDLERIEVLRMERSDGK